MKILIYNYEVDTALHLYRQLMQGIGRHCENQDDESKLWEQGGLLFTNINCEDSSSNWNRFDLLFNYIISRFVLYYEFESKLNRTLTVNYLFHRESINRDFAKYPDWDLKKSRVLSRLKIDQLKIKRKLWWYYLGKKQWYSETFKDSRISA